MFLKTEINKNLIWSNNGFITVFNFFSRIIFKTGLYIDWEKSSLNQKKNRLNKILRRVNHRNFMKRYKNCPVTKLCGIIKIKKHRLQGHLF